MKVSFRKLWLLVGFLLISVGFIYAIRFNVLKVFAADSPWTQTDWVNGVGSSTVNQFESSNNVSPATLPTGSGDSSFGG